MRLLLSATCRFIPLSRSDPGGRVATSSDFSKSVRASRRMSPNTIAWQAGRRPAHSTKTMREEIGKILARHPLTHPYHLPTCPTRLLTSTKIIHGLSPYRFENECAPSFFVALYDVLPARPMAHETFTDRSVYQ